MLKDCPEKNAPTASLYLQQDCGDWAREQVEEVFGSQYGPPYDDFHYFLWGNQKLPIGNMKNFDLVTDFLLGRWLEQHPEGPGVVLWGLP